MRFNLLPKEEKFFELFRAQVKIVKEGVEALNELVNDYTDIQNKYLKIRQIEHNGDIITHDIFSKLKTSFITPIDREDIHELASGLDDVLDCVEGVASRLNYFEIKQPTSELIQLVSIIDQAIHQIYQAVDNLEKLENTETFCHEVNKLENQADIICQEATSNLFKKTNEVEQLKSLIKWKEIYNRLEIAADRCEDVANVIEGISIKHV